MNKLFYPKLAINNIKKNSKTYVPYILTCIGTITMFYNMCFLSRVKDMGHISKNEALRTILILGSIVIGIFSVIFLFYTNSFLIKRRKKEFGLFNILGMEKKHIVRIMFFETLFVALLTLTAGLLAGIALSKLMVLLLFKMIAFKVVFGFEIPLPAVIATLVLFCGIYAINLLYNFIQIHLSKPVELLKGGNVGEKEPRTKWIMASIGAICLGIGYYIAITTESPLSALMLFFVAVTLVIAGTYCLFTAGSIALLKMFRRNKNYYYKLKHFTSVSGMIYRMKQNAAGLANICILSTAVIVMISSTISLYVGMEDALRTRYQRNIVITADNVTEKQSKELNAVIAQQTSKAGIKQKNILYYNAMSFPAVQKKARFTTIKHFYVSDNVAEAVFITLKDYNRLEHKNVKLSPDETLLYTIQGKIEGNTVNFGDLKLSIKEHLKSFSPEAATSTITRCYYFIVDDISTIRKVYASCRGDKAYINGLSYFYGFDVIGDKNAELNIITPLRNALRQLNISVYVDGAENSKEMFLTLYGGLFFLGLFLGLLFIMATVLIIYYKQIAEGYEDKERFEIMQKVGMSHEEVRKSIRSQVLTVFFLPLAAAIIHLAFAFKVITKLLLIFGMTNVSLYLLYTIVTILVFAVLYAAVYALTARTYYRIVLKSAIE